MKKTVLKNLLVGLSSFGLIAPISTIIYNINAKNTTRGSVPKISDSVWRSGKITGNTDVGPGLQQWAQHPHYKYILTLSNASVQSLYKSVSMSASSSDFANQAYKYFQGAWKLRNDFLPYLHTLEYYLFEDIWGDWQNLAKLKTELTTAYKQDAPLQLTFYTTRGGNGMHGVAHWNFYYPGSNPYDGSVEWAHWY